MTGQIESEVTRQLAAQRVPTRALIRNRQTAKTLEGLGVEIVPAALGQPDSLDVALRRAERACFVAGGEAIRLWPNSAGTDS